MAHVTIRMILGSALVAGGLGAAVAAVPAASAAAGPETTIRLGVVPKAGGQARFATVTCDPVGGTHPEAAAVCDELAKADGDIKLVPPQKGRFCSAVWIPVDATASGYWRGHPVEFSQTVSNDDCARIAHGLVFDF